MRKFFVITALLLLGALVVGDIAARNFAQDRLAETIESAGAPSDVDVKIGGRSFLWQLIQGRYESVTASTTSLGRNTQLPITDATVNFSGARVDTMDLMRREMINTVPTDSVRVEVTSSYDALTKAISTQLDPSFTQVDVKKGEDSDVLLTARVMTPTGVQQISAPMNFTVTDSTSIRASVAPSAIQGIPDSVARSLAPKLATSIEIPQLPYGLKLNPIAFNANDIVFTANAAHVDVLSWYM